MSLHYIFTKDGKTKENIFTQVKSKSMIDCNQGRKEEWQHHYFLFFYLLEPGIQETGSVTTTGYH